MARLSARVYKEFDFCSGNSSIDLRAPVFANGKADKTFNMFKLASISIIPLRDYLVMYTYADVLLVERFLSARGNERGIWRRNILGHSVNKSFGSHFLCSKIMVYGYI